MKLKGRLKSALPEGYINDINGSNAEIDISAEELAEQLTKQLSSEELDDPLLLYKDGEKVGFNACIAEIKGRMK